VRLVRELLRREGRDVAVTRGSTYDNKDNLAPQFLAEIVARYEGTRLSRQELMAELLEDVPGALWTRGLIEATRAAPERVAQALPGMIRIVVAIDPAVSQGEAADETGIIVAGLGENGLGYVLADLSGRFAPHDWAGRAVSAYRHWRADRIVAEANNGGDLVTATLRVVDPAASCRLVRASRGKRARAEPVAALYEQGRVRHWGCFPALEDEMCSFAPGEAGGPSPDRLDALVWALTELMVEPQDTALLDYYREVAGAGHRLAIRGAGPLTPHLTSPLSPAGRGEREGPAGAKRRREGEG
jgi:phage terminase large subunit-like protein